MGRLLSGCVLQLIRTHLAEPLESRSHHANTGLFDNTGQGDGVAGRYWRLDHDHSPDLWKPNLLNHYAGLGVVRIVVHGIDVVHERVPNDHRLHFLLLSCRLLRE